MQSQYQDCGELKRNEAGRSISRLQSFIVNLNLLISPIVPFNIGVPINYIQISDSSERDWSLSLQDSLTELTSAAAQTLWSGSTATRLPELFCMTATSQEVVPYLLPTSSTPSEGRTSCLTARMVSVSTPHQAGVKFSVKKSQPSSGTPRGPRAGNVRTESRSDCQGPHLCRGWS